jgi:hypothetical protein
VLPAGASLPPADQRNSAGVDVSFDRDSELPYWGDSVLRVLVVANHLSDNYWPGRLHLLARGLGAGAWLWPGSVEDPVRLVDVLVEASKPRPRSGGASEEITNLPDSVSGLREVDLFVGAPRLAGSALSRIAALEETSGRSGHRGEQVRYFGSAGRAQPYRAWTAVSVKENIRDIRRAPGISWGVSRGTLGARTDHAVLCERDGIPVLRLPVGNLFLRASDTAYWATLLAFGGSPAKKHDVPGSLSKPQDALLRPLVEAARTRIREMITASWEEPAMDVGWRQLSGGQSDVTDVGERLERLLHKRAQGARQLWALPAPSTDVDEPPAIRAI